MGSNIREIRRQRGYRSAAALSAALCLSGYDCSPSLVKRWEAGRGYPTVPAIVALCRLLDVTADHLIFGPEK